MARTPKLTDIQLILLTTAAQRPDGCLLPLASSIEDQADRIGKAIPPLIKRALAEEAEVTDAGRSWRNESDGHMGLFITDAGRVAVGVEPAADRAPLTVNGGSDVAGPASAPKPTSKIALVSALLCRPEGASLAEMVETTGWLPHTTRAALTGLRKKGHTIDKTSRDGVTMYSIAAAV